MKTKDSSELFSALTGAQRRFALRVVARLNDSAEAMAPEIAERLRFSRESALRHAHVVRAANAALPVATNSGALMLGGWAPDWGVKVASILPLFALVAGMVLIQHTQTQAQISITAEIDAALLADDLPPRAYSDAGFVEFLKLPKD
ncbi:MAG: DUF3619 family protein [Burkholderiaceae bacterium]